MQNGTFDFSSGTKTFDLFSQAETNSLVSVTGNQLQLSYIDEEGKLIQLRKNLPENPLNIQIGSKLITSAVQDQYGAGFLESANARSVNVVGKSLAEVNWVTPDTSKYTTKTFTDTNGIQQTAVLLPIILS